MGNEPTVPKVFNFDSNSSVPLSINILAGTPDETEPLIVTVQVTEEGLIIDFFIADELVATTAKTYHEWAEEAGAWG